MLMGLKGLPMRRGKGGGGGGGGGGFMLRTAVWVHFTLILIEQNAAYEVQCHA